MTAEEERVLAWTLLGEAADQGRTGMEAVAFVIRNRTESGRFPNNPATVALQPGQFSTWNAISNGGNIPRARYTADSPIFQTALSAVRKVFSVTPGRDPTQGATHYYAPNGMAGGAAPYWWNGESTAAGNVRVGGHIFAAKYEPKVAPVPASRSGTDPIGGFPSAKQLDFVRTGQAVRLPDIPESTLRYDPVRKTMVRTGSTVELKSNVEMQRREQQAQRRVAASSGVTRTAGVAGQVALPAGVRPNVPSTEPARRSVAGFAVPKGTTGIAVVDAERQLAANAKTEVRLNTLNANQSHVERGAPRVQTQFAQPSGSLLSTKDQTRLVSPKGLDQKVSASDLARGKSKPVAVVAPVMPELPRARPVRVPTVIPTVQRQPVPAARRALTVTVQGARTATVARQLAQTPTDTLREQGLSPSEAYDQARANEAARASSEGRYTSDNASNNGGRGSGPGGSLSRGDRSYDADTNSWN